MKTPTSGPKQRKAQGFFQRLKSCRTPSGMEIYNKETTRENHLRKRLALLSLMVATALERSEVPEIDLEDAVGKLREQVGNPAHYGENNPNSHFSDGTPVTPDPYFSFGDMLSFGRSSEEGFDQFARIAKLRPSVDESAAIGVVALLLIESAVAHLDRGDTILAAAEALEAADIAGDLLVDAGIRSGASQRTREFARLGGKKRHRETEILRVRVLEEWDTGRFMGNKSRAARWACLELKLSSEEVVTRWIRAHEKQKATT